MKDVLRKLCQDPRNEVWVISSSGSMAVEKTLGDFDNMGLIAVNGLKVRRVSLLLLLLLLLLFTITFIIYSLEVHSGFPLQNIVENPCPWEIRF